MSGEEEERSQTTGKREKEKEKPFSFRASITCEKTVSFLSLGGRAKRRRRSQKEALSPPSSLHPLYSALPPINIHYFRKGVTASPASEEEEQGNRKREKRRRIPPRQREKVDEEGGSQSSLSFSIGGAKGVRAVARRRRSSTPNILLI